MLIRREWLNTLYVAHAMEHYVASINSVSGPISLDLEGSPLHIF